eukprot:gene446-863_t
MGVQLSLLVALGEFSTKPQANKQRRFQDDAVDETITENIEDASDALELVGDVITIEDVANTNIDIAEVDKQDTNIEDFNNDNISVENVDNENNDIERGENGNIENEFNEIENIDDHDVDDETVDIVLSRVSCERSLAINALLSHGNDIELAVSFLLETAEHVVGSSSETNGDVVSEDPNLELSQPTNRNEVTDEISTESSYEPIAHPLPSNMITDEISISTESSCEPIALPLPSGRVWGRPETYEVDDVSTISGGISYVPSTVQFGVLRSHIDDSAGSKKISADDALFKDLFMACRVGEVGLVKKIGERGRIDVNRLMKGDSSGHGDGDITIKRLLDNGYEGSTPLHMASRQNHLEVVTTLIRDYKAQVNARDARDHTPLHLAAEKGHLEVVKALIHDFNAKVDAKDKDSHIPGVSVVERTPLHLAAERGHLEVVKTLIHDFSAKVNAKDKDNYTPLHLAAERGGLEVVEALIRDFNAEVDAKDKDGRTPLHLAAWNTRLEVVKALIYDFSAKIEAKNQDGRTPLHLAAERGPSHSVAEKRAYGEVLEAIERRHLEVVKALIHDFSVDAEDKWGWTPLHSAAEYGHFETVKFLINCLKDKYPSTWLQKITSKNKDGKSPQQRARRGAKYPGRRSTSYTAIVELLSSAIDQAIAEGQDPDYALHYASENNSLKLVKVLIQDFSAQVDAKNKSGDNPLHVAAKEGHLEVVKFLINYLKDTYPSTWLQRITSKNKASKSPLQLARKESQNHYDYVDAHRKVYTEIVELLSSEIDQAIAEGQTLEPEEEQSKKCLIQ